MCTDQLNNRVESLAVCIFFCSLVIQQALCAGKQKLSKLLRVQKAVLTSVGKINTTAKSREKQKKKKGGALIIHCQGMLQNLLKSYTFPEAEIMILRLIYIHINIYIFLLICFQQQSGTSMQRSAAQGFQVMKTKKTLKFCEGLRPPIFILISRKRSGTNCSLEDKSRQQMPWICQVQIVSNASYSLL